MRKLALVFGITLALAPSAVAYDIAFYVGAPNSDGWYDVPTQTKDVDTIIAKTGQLFKDIQRFDDAHLSDFGTWIDKNTNDGEMDIIWLNGCTPSVLYQFPNVNADGSRAEKWLDGGNMIINVGDWFAYCSYEGGARQADNGGTGAANILDLSSAIIAGGGQGEMVVTPAGQEYLPSLNVVTSDRPIQLSIVVYPWEVAEVFAQNAAGAYADPLVIHNTVTGGYMAFVNQAGAGNWIADRGLTCAELIGNWVKKVIGLDPQPFARGPNPINGSMIDQTRVTQASWTAGDFATQHDVYFGDSYEKVSTATPVNTDVYFGRQATTKLLMGMKGGPVPTGLVPGTTYYWRVDEINTSNPASPWKGAVWSFRVRPQAAWEPNPADGGKYVRVDQKLIWNSGLNAQFHYVYIGQSIEEVQNATEDTAFTATDPELAPDPPLTPGITYYWRVDEFTTKGVIQGQIWSFVMVPVLSVADPTLSGHWMLDEGEGTTAVDWSGHGGHGTLIGGPQWADGLYGGALSFSGAGQYVNCGTGAEDITADFTLAAWIKMAPGNAGKYMGIAGRLNGVYQGFGLVRHSSNVLRLWVGDGTTDLAKSAVNSDTRYTDTEWHHVAMTHEGQANRLFVDGKRQSGTTNITLVPNPQFFHIGRQYSHLDDRYFNGLIDDVRVYNKAMAEEQINQVLVGYPLVASKPVPGVGAITDIRDAGSLSWSAGAGADSHDVYFGTDRKAVAGAGKSSPEFKGNQLGTSFSLACLVAFGSGDRYWRIDEVEAGGQVHTGYVWTFTVPPYLSIDDFESYTDEVGKRVFQTWLDGAGYTEPTVVPGNGTGSLIGYDPTVREIMESSIVHGGGKSMPFEYNNVDAPYYSETSRTWSTAQDWTVEGVTTLVLFVRGVKGNDATQPLYVALENQGKTAAVVGLGTVALKATTWTELKVPLSQFTGVSLTAIKKMYIGVGDRANPKKGGHGVLYIDDIRLVKP